MRDILSSTPNFKPLTPERALEYLKNKPIYLSTWEKLVPTYFFPNVLCSIVNNIRTKMIQNREEINEKINELESKKANEGLTQQESKILDFWKQKKTTVFNDVFTEVFNQKIKPVIKYHGIRETKQLIGSLSNISKTQKERIQEFTETVNYELQKDFSYIDVYEDEIRSIVDDLIEKSFSQDLGGSISEGEKKELGKKAWSIFLKNHESDIKNKEIDIIKLNSHLHKKKIL